MDSAPFEPLATTDYSPGPEAAAPDPDPAPATEIGTVSIVPPHILERITIRPVAPWIVERPTNLEEQKGEGSNPTYLIDWQHHVSRQETYHRSVHRLDTMNAVSRASQWRLIFDPATERLTIHALLVRRGERVAENAKPERLRVLQREERLDSQVLHGRLTVVVLLEDVRLGDILDLSFTIHSQNRVFPTHFTRLVHIPNWTLREFHLTARFPTGRPMRWKSNDEKLAPTIREDGDETEWSWDLAQLPGSEPEVNVPGWHVENRWIQLTDFASWAEVVSGMLAAWREDLQNPEVLRLVESIAAEAATPALRAERALTYLQDEIRYLSDNTELGGQTPTSPGVIIKRGFGDCKDKSFAAAHLLRLLGIPARPVLVNTDLCQSVQEFLPTPGIFNHAIVEYEVDDRRRWVDVTLPLQGGSVLSRPNAQFKLGLPLGPGVEDLEPIPSDASDDRTELKETFYLDTSGHASTLHVQVTAAGREAERWRRSLAHDGVEAFARERELFYQQLFAGAKRIAKLEWRDDREHNELVLAEAFELRDVLFPLHDRSGFLFRFRAHTIQSVLGFADSGRRRQPWKLPFPCRIRHVIEIESSEVPQNLVRTAHVDSKAFRFSCHGQRRPGYTSATYLVQVLTDHVSAADFEAFKQRARDALSCTVIMGQLPRGAIARWKARSIDNLLPRRGTPSAPLPSPSLDQPAADAVPVEVAPVLTSRPQKEKGIVAPREEKASRPNGSAQRREEGAIRRPNPIVPPPPPPLSNTESAASEHGSRRRRSRRRHRRNEHGVLFWIGTIVGAFLLLLMILFLTHAK